MKTKLLSNPIGEARVGFISGEGTFRALVFHREKKIATAVFLPFGNYASRIYS